MQKNGKLAGADLIASILLFALGAWVFMEAKAMKVFRTLIISPGLFPLILGGVFMFCGLVLFFMAIKRGGFSDMRRILSPATVGQTFNSPTFRRGLTILLMIVAYVYLFGSRLLSPLNFIVNIGDQVVSINTGFILVTSTYLFCTFMYLKAMKWKSSLLVSICAAVIVFFAFNRGFGIPIP